MKQIDTCTWCSRCVEKCAPIPRVLGFRTNALFQQSDAEIQRASVIKRAPLLTSTNIHTQVNIQEVIVSISACARAGVFRLTLHTVESASSQPTISTVTISRRRFHHCLCLESGNIEACIKDDSIPLALPCRESNWMRSGVRHVRRSPACLATITVHTVDLQRSAASGITRSSLLGVRTYISPYTDYSLIVTES